MRKTLSFIIASMCFIWAQTAEAAKTTSISQRGITWHFDSSYEYGQFANGDYWVLGPLTLIRIEPDFDGSNNGWEINPLVGNDQGFQANASNFNRNLVPTLPLRVEGIKSIVKVAALIPAQGAYTVKTAAVLTVVDAIPPNEGKNVFRPPYVGNNKPYYLVENIRRGALPEYNPVPNTPTLLSVEQNFTNFRLEHTLSTNARQLHPKDAMRDYQPENTLAINDAVLRLMLNDPYNEKLNALIKILQHGIDKCYAIIYGWNQPLGGGHQPGHLSIPSFTAAILNIAEAKQAINRASGFHEDQYCYISDKTGMALWGQKASEKSYWDFVMGLGGNRSNADPYSYIDGGTVAADYQLMVAQAWKGQILTTLLMPELKEIWNPSLWSKQISYVQRWVNQGAVAQPDPCAPFDGIISNYGITYGPDFSNPGMCIKDRNLAYFRSATDFECKIGQVCGRFPQRHGLSKDGGLYKSRFVENLWNAYIGLSSLNPGEQPIKERIQAPKNLKILK